MTSSHHGPYALGYTRATMVGTEGCEAARRSQSQKPGPSSDCRLQLACMKPESLVIADQLRRGEYVPGSCTHRPSHHESRVYRKPLTPTPQGEGGDQGMPGDWGEVVTR